jgi:ParB-like chromosome segregation protein Spo0J
MLTFVLEVEQRLCQEVDVEISYRTVSDLREWGYSQKLFRPLHEADFKRLVESVQQHGVRVPVAVRADNLILCGHYRVKAAVQAGLDAVPCVEVALPSETEYRLYAIDDNLQRRHMLAAERAAVFVERKKLLEDLRRRGESRDSGRVRDLAAKGLGVSGRQVAKYEKIAARLPADVVEMVDSGALGIEAAAGIADHCDGPVAAKVARRVVADKLTAPEAKTLAAAYATDRSSIDMARKPAESLQLGPLMTGLAQILEVSMVDPARLVGACSRADLNTLHDLVANAEAYLRKLRREVMRGLAVRSAGGDIDRVS